MPRKKKGIDPMFLKLLNPEPSGPYVIQWDEKFPTGNKIKRMLVNQKYKYNALRKRFYNLLDVWFEINGRPNLLGNKAFVKYETCYYRVQQDDDNLIMSGKPFFDALVDHGIIVDDSHQYLCREYAQFQGKKGLIVTIRRATEDDERLIIRKAAIE